MRSVAVEMLTNKSEYMVKWRSAQGLPALNATSHFIVLKERLMSDSNSTIKFCKKCMAETERYAYGKCKPCASARSASWQKANSEKNRANHIAYYAKNRKEILADKSDYYAKHAERLRAYAVDRYVANPAKMKAKSSAYRVANLDVFRIYYQNRKSRKQMNGGSLSKGLASKLFLLQKGKCPCCAQPLGDDYHLDHIKPLALGGQNTDDNMQLLRAICNLQKHAKHPVDFMQSRGFLL